MDNTSHATEIFKKFENRVLDTISMFGICNGTIIGYIALAVITNFSNLGIIELTAVIIEIIAMTQFVSATKRLSTQLRQTYDEFDSSGLNYIALEFKNSTGCCLMFFGAMNMAGLMVALCVWGISGANIHQLSGWLICGAELIALIATAFIVGVAKLNKMELLAICKTMTTN